MQRPSANTTAIDCSTRQDAADTQQNKSTGASAWEQPTQTGAGTHKVTALVPKLSPPLYKYTPNPASQLATTNGPNCRPANLQYNANSHAQKRQNHTQANRTHQGTHAAAKLSQQTPTCSKCAPASNKPRFLGYAASVYLGNSAPAAAANDSLPAFLSSALQKTQPHDLPDAASCQTRCCNNRWPGITHDASHTRRWPKPADHGDTQLNAHRVEMVGHSSSTQARIVRP